MELLRPNPGVCVDRQTILILKIEAGKKQNIFVKHWGDECNEIQEYLRKEFFLLVPRSIQDPYDRLYKQLEAVNTELWNLEDEQRLALAEFEKDALGSTALLMETGKRSFRITKLNNQRAKLVQEIDTLFGILPLTQKIHKGQSQ